MPRRKAATITVSGSRSEQVEWETYRAYDTSTPMVEVRAALKALDVKVPGSARSKVAHLEILHATLNTLYRERSSENNQADGDSKEEPVSMGRRRGSRAAKAADDKDVNTSTKFSRRSKRSRSDDELGDSEADASVPPSESEKEHAREVEARGGD